MARIWSATAFAGFCLWLAATAASTGGETASTLVELTASFGFVIACTSACFALTAIFLRFLTRPSRTLTRLGDNAFGIYFFHLFFTVWLQYLLLSLPLFEISYPATPEAGRWIATTIMEQLDHVR